MVDSRYTIISCTIKTKKKKTIANYMMICSMQDEFNFRR